MVRVYTDGLDNYTPWSGAVDTMETIKRHGLTSALEDWLEDVFPDGASDTEINDVLWFDADWVLESLGLQEDNDDV